MAKQLKETSYCIVCVTTPQVAKSPWVNFEAGAVSKYVEDAHVSPLLIRATPEELVDLPLARFQCTRFNRQDIGRLLRSMNDEVGSPISNDQLNANLRNTWKQLKDDVGGLDFVEDSRNDVLDDDKTHQSDQGDGASLSSKAVAILDFLASKHTDFGDGFAVFDSGPTLEDICGHIKTDNRIRVKYHLDKLLGDGLIREGENRFYQKVYNITASGRAHVVEKERG